MIEKVSELIVDFFNENVVLATMFISMIPLFELKVGIPFGMNAEFWAVPLSNWGALFSAVGGGFFVTLILALLFKPLYEKIKDKKFFKSTVSFFVGDALKKSQEIQEKTINVKNLRKTLLKILAVFLFVSIPVPGTGVWTGTVFAIFLGLGFWKTILTVTLGNFCAGLIIMFICSVFPAINTILMIVFIVLVVVYLLWRTILHIIKKKNEKKKELLE